VTNPYLTPVGAVWRRVAGIVLLVAGAGLTGVMSVQLLDLARDEESRRAVTISTVIFGLILLALCGICWQAGYRLVFNRPDRSGTLFSRPAWLAIGTGLVVITVLMAISISAARRPTLLDVQVLLFLGGIGVWCVVLALKSMRG
jgi:vacuolar-type H+-ATPase subunit I/STV1